MNVLIKNSVILSISMLFSFGLTAQYVLKGKITDEMDQGIPYGDIYVKNYPDLRTRADIEGNYVMRLLPGEYYMVFAAQGYETREFYMPVLARENTLDMQLFPVQVKDLEGIDFSTKRRNVGRDIVLKTVAIKDKINFGRYPYSVDAFIRAKDISIGTMKKNEKNQRNEGDARYDDIDDLKRKSLAKIGGGNMVEIELKRSFSPTNKQKEERTAYRKMGSDKYLYFTTTAASDFNFFKNLLYLDDLSKTPIQSPISTAGILSYKYQLIEKEKREGRQSLNKIKITSRNTATSTLEGFLWIEDSTWLVEKIDFSINKGNLFIYDQFRIQQDFINQGDSLAVLIKQEFDYEVSYRREKITGNTIVDYSNYNFDPIFEKGFFGNEVAITTEEAYLRDSSYWSSRRLTPLTLEEQEFIKKRDSIENLFTKKTYLDSIDSLFNKITFWKVAWFGIERRNRVKKTQWAFSSIAGMIRPIYIAGPRIGLDFEFFKKFDDETTLETFTRVDVGVLNADVKGYTNIYYMYNPIKRARVGFNFTHNYDLIRSYDALTQILLRDNFIRKTSARVSHEFELFNGLDLNTRLIYAYRQSLPEDTKFLHWLDKPLNNYTEPPKFDPYNSLIAEITLSYTPFQKYMREPLRKVILGSKWPTFFIYYEKGIPKIVGSETNHDYLQLGLSQTFNVGTLGTSSYRATTGKFLNTKGLFPEDYKYHKRGDPLLFSNALYSYQDLDTTLPTLNWYLETHYIHHFNGALINKIPFMKKTGITTVAGGGFLWIPEHKWMSWEAYVGLERIFKFAKRRLRIGAYAVFSQGNIMRHKTTFKVSFAILDERDMKFNF